MKTPLPPVLHGQWIDASIQLTSALGGGYHQTVK